MQRMKVDIKWAKVKQMKQDHGITRSKNFNTLHTVITLKAAFVLYITSDTVMPSFRYFLQNSVFWISIRKTGQEK
jgi:hypothetical protein